MAEDGTTAPGAGTVAALVQEVLSVVPAGCTWLLPIGAEGDVVDFRIAAASDRRPDIYGRGVARVDERLSELYPSMVGGPLLAAVPRVMATGEPGQLADFRYQEQRAGVVADSLFDVSVHRVLGGLMVWWQRLDERPAPVEPDRTAGQPRAGPSTT